MAGRKKVAGRFLGSIKKHLHSECSRRERCISGDSVAGEAWSKFDFPPFIDADNQHLRGPWNIARHFKQYHVIEYLVNKGIPVTIEAPTNSSLSPDLLTMQRRLTNSEACHWFGWGAMTDLYIHLPTQVTKGTRADRVTD